MLTAARIGAWKGSGVKPLTLPRRVAWIENDASNGQFLNMKDLGTVIYGNIKLSTESDFYSAQQDDAVFATGGGKGSRSIFISDTQIALRQRTTNVLEYNTNTIGSVYEIKFGKNGTSNFIKQNGVVVAESEYNWQSTTLANLGVFASGSSTATQVDHLRFLSFVNDEVEIYPYLDQDGVPCVKDEVSGQFFYNQGTGEFTWGELGTELAGGGYKCVRRSWRSASRRSRHFSRWEVAA